MDTGLGSLAPPHHRMKESVQARQNTGSRCFQGSCLSRVRRRQQVVCRIHRVSPLRVAQPLLEELLFSVGGVAVGLCARHWSLTFPL